MSDHIPDGSKMDTPRTDSWHCLSVGGLKVVPASFARQLERELADMTAFRDSEMRWANQYKQERDKARECLREAICYRDSSMSGYDLEEWREAAGENELTNGKKDKKAPIVNREEEQ